MALCTGPCTFGFEHLNKQIGGGDPSTLLWYCRAGAAMVPGGKDDMMAIGSSIMPDWMVKLLEWWSLVTAAWLCRRAKYFL
jgi:hypothetical protein